MSDIQVGPADRGTWRNACDRYERRRESFHQTLEWAHFSALPDECARSTPFAPIAFRRAWAKKRWQLAHIRTGNTATHIRAIGSHQSEDLGEMVSLEL